MSWRMHWALDKKAWEQTIQLKDKAGQVKKNEEKFSFSTRVPLIKMAPGVGFDFLVIVPAAVKSNPRGRNAPALPSCQHC